MLDSTLNKETKITLHIQSCINSAMDIGSSQRILLTQA